MDADGSDHAFTGVAAVLNVGFVLVGSPAVFFFSLEDDHDLVFI